MKPTPILACTLALLGCGAPTPNHLVRLGTPSQPRFAVSTEDGLLALQGDDLLVDRVPIEFWFSAQSVTDTAVVERRGENLVRLRAESARLPFAELGAMGPLPGEPLFVQIIDDDPEHRPRLLEASLLAGGEFGDLIDIDEWFWSAEEVAADFPGAGVYALRDGRYELVGLLTDLVATNPDDSFLGSVFGPSAVIPYLALDAIAPVLPESSDFFRRRVRVFRPDFEHGIPNGGPVGSAGR